MKKKIILLSIILFPSLIYLFFEMTKANFKKMAYFGPKTLNIKGDTVYYRIPEIEFDSCRVTKNSNNEDGSVASDALHIDTVNYPVYCILFLNKKYSKDGYKIDGLLDFVKYKPKELKQIPFLFISQKADSNEIYQNEKTKEVKKNKTPLNGDFDSIPIKLSNFIPARISYKINNRDSFLNATYFKQKPYYVFDYFIVLVDKQRHIRGYYDPTFNAEITRMIADYKHLKIRDGYAQTQKQNDIKQH